MLANLIATRHRSAATRHESLQWHSGWRLGAGAGARYAHGHIALAATEAATRAASERCTAQWSAPRAGRARTDPQDDEGTGQQSRLGSGAFPPAGMPAERIMVAR